MSKVLRNMAVVAGVVAGAVIAKKIIENYEDDATYENDRFERLIKKQYVCDVLDGAIVANWFNEYEKKVDGEKHFFVARITEETAKMFALGNIPEELDREHCLLQAIVTKEEYKTRALRLISYSVMIDELENLFGDEDYIIFEEGEKNE